MPSPGRGMRVGKASPVDRYTEPVRITPRMFLWLVRRAMASAFDDNCFGIAKGAAYSALLSFFPVLTSAATILLQTRAAFVSRMLESTLSQIVPPGTEDLVVQQFRITGARPVALLIVANAISLWAASSVIKSLIEGFQAAYHVPRNRGFLHGSAVAMSLVLLSALPLLCASLLVLFGGELERAALNAMKVDPILTPLAGLWQVLSRIARYLLAFATMVSVTSMLYLFRTLPQTTLAICMARRNSGDYLLARRHGRFWLVCGAYRELQRDVWVGGRRDRTAGVDVPDGGDRPDWL